MEKSQQGGLLKYIEGVTLPQISEMPIGREKKRKCFERKRGKGAGGRNRKEKGGTFFAGGFQGVQQLTS